MFLNMMTKKGWQHARWAAGMLVAGWGLAWAPLHGAVVINEIHYDPDVKTEWVEFVELYNSDPEPVDLSGWQLAKAVEFTFPAGTEIAPGGYLVAARDPDAVRAKFGVTALGPWVGRLDNQGETLVLRDAAGQKVDEVDYRLGFPWPIVGDPPGYSIELINPALDNGLGGNWRPSVVGSVAPTQDLLIRRGTEWRYHKGLTPPSDPATAWRDRTFDDADWAAGKLPIGYGENFMVTSLADMRGNYTSVFLRKTFTVDDPAAVGSLLLRLMYDDGCKVWINGVHVLDQNIASGEVPYTGTANHAIENKDYLEFPLNNPTYLRAGENVIAIQGHNASISGSSDFFLDVELLATTGPSGHGPTPGGRNVVFAANAPPAIRQVAHHPKQPAAGEPVVVTARITDPDGVKSVFLDYQVVKPGHYIELTDKEYETRWTRVTMNDAGQNGDEVAGDDVFSVTLPAELQQHRRLIRYRIYASDGAGLEIRAPGYDDPQPNFAWFVYNGVPAWHGAVDPASAGDRGIPFTVPAGEMNRLPVYHLIAKRQAVEDATWFSRYRGDLYKWSGTLVYDGVVYDHIHYRARGGVWRYSMCKNMWKFDFNRGHDFQPRDDWGRKLKTRWTKLNLGASIQQGSFGHRGEQGMFESVGFRLFNLAGVPAMHTAYVQFRVIDDAAEAVPDDQYEGDFWGVYLATEQPNGRFLDEHGLPDGNFYKMEGGSGTLNNLGFFGPDNKSDLNRFLNDYNTRDEDWWYAHVDVPAYLSYQAIVQGIHHYDICHNKNYFYYFNPFDGRVTVVPWDLDLTWAENMYDAGCGGVDNIKKRMLANPATQPRLFTDWRNRVREVRDLLWNEDEGWRVIDEMAGRLRGPAATFTLLDADRAQWDYNPKMVDPRYTDHPDSKAGHGRFYQWPREPGVSKDFAGCVRLMKNYVVFRASNSSARARPLDAIARDPDIPPTPEITYTGPEEFPVNQLSFKASAYQGHDRFGAIRWRVGEITRPRQGSWAYKAPWKYEIEAVWELRVPRQKTTVTVPAGALKVGHVYRARVQYVDYSGRASHWSAPVEFVAGQADNTVTLRQNLVLSELMYQAPGGSDFDFLEFYNRDPDEPLSLGGVTFTDGIEFTFPPGALLPPNGRLLLVRADPADDFAAFRAHYGLGADARIFGPYDGKLSNGGERLTLKSARGGSVIFSFTYRDGRGWPLTADGAGHSLVWRGPTDAPLADGMLNYGGNWRASARIGGSPGAPEPEPSVRLLINEVVAHTDLSGEFDSNDWIELFNPAGTNLTLGPGWFLSDSLDDLRKWEIPADTVVPARGFVVFDELTGFHNPTNQGFGLSKDGEQVLLSFLPGDTGDAVVDAVRFPAQENDWSWGRVEPDLAWWAPLTPRTPGAPNAPLPAAPRFTEIMYHPRLSGSPPAENPAHEFVELSAPARAVPCWNTNGVWRISGDIGFEFPPEFTLPAQARLLVVNFDPDDDAARAEFVAAYGLKEADLLLLGPFQGRLSNGGGRLTLEKPQASDDPDRAVAWVTVDEVIFADAPPWPTGADGDGRSLARARLDRPGNDPANWSAELPTPGEYDAGVSLDADQDGLPDDWERAHELNPNDPNDADGDSDHDGLTNREEYHAGTDPQSAASTLRITTVTVAASEPRQVKLTFDAIAGKDYSVFRTTALGSGVWEKVADVPAVRCNCEQEVVDEAPPETGPGFYRLVTPAQP